MHWVNQYDKDVRTGGVLLLVLIRLLAFPLVWPFWIAGWIFRKAGFEFR